jgi:hypothetical protein
MGRHLKDRVSYGQRTEVSLFPETYAVAADL